MGDASVSVTSLFDPVDDTAVTVTGTPLFSTVKSEGNAVVERIVSLNLKVIVVPLVATEADDSVGGV